MDDEKKLEDISLTRKNVRFFINRSIVNIKNDTFIKNRYNSLFRIMLFSKNIIDRYNAFSVDKNLDRAVMVFLKRFKDKAEKEEEKNEDIEELKSLLYLLKDYDNFKNDLMGHQEAFFDSVLEGIGLSLAKLKVSGELDNGNLGIDMIDLAGLYSKSLGNKELRQDIIDECMAVIDDYEKKIGRKFKYYDETIDKMSDRMTGTSKSSSYSFLDSCFDMIDRQNKNINKKLSKFDDKILDHAKRINALSETSLKLLKHIYNDNNIPTGKQILKRDFSDQELKYEIRRLLDEELKVKKKDKSDINDLIYKDYDKVLSILKNEVESDIKDYYDRLLSDRFKQFKDNLDLDNIFERDRDEFRELMESFKKEFLKYMSDQLDDTGYSSISLLEENIINSVNFINDYNLNEINNLYNIIQGDNDDKKEKAISIIREVYKEDIGPNFNDNDFVYKIIENKTQNIYKNDINNYEQKLENKLSVIREGTDLIEKYVGRSLDEANKPHVNEIVVDERGIGERVRFEEEQLLSNRFIKRDIRSDKKDNTDKLIKSKIESVQNIILSTIKDSIDANENMTSKDKQDTIKYIYDEIKDNSEFQNIVADDIFNSQVNVTRRVKKAPSPPIKAMSKEIRNMIDLVLLENEPEFKVIDKFIRKDHPEKEQVESELISFNESKLVKKDLPELRKVNKIINPILEKLEIIEDMESVNYEIYREPLVKKIEHKAVKNLIGNIIESEELFIKPERKTRRLEEEVVNLVNKINKVNKTESQEVTNVSEKVDLTDIINTENMLKVQNEKNEEFIRNQESRIDILNEYIEEQRETINILKREQTEQRELIEEVMNIPENDYDSIGTNIMSKIESDIRMERIRNGVI